MMCREHRCLFVHVPKTAGMSIEDAFLRRSQARPAKAGAPQGRRVRRSRAPDGGAVRGVLQVLLRAQSLGPDRLGVQVPRVSGQDRFQDLPLQAPAGSRLRLIRRALWGRERQHTFPHYTEYYDDESREFVGRLFRKDVETFNYAFGDRVRSAAPAPP
jgi:hypothetical protein